MIGVPTPNRERFLAAIAERVPPDRVEAVFLFPPIRQGAQESGVAVLAVTAAIPAVELQNAELQNAELQNAELQNAEPQNAEPQNAELPGVEIESSSAVGSPAVGSPAVGNPAVSSPVVGTPRPTVLTARYRHTLKGPDRGKWELEILEQADAPLVTIEMVVRGVQERLDDTSEPERLGAEELRAALADGVWTAPQR